SAVSHLALRREPLTLSAAVRGVAIGFVPASVEALSFWIVVVVEQPKEAKPNTNTNARPIRMRTSRRNGKRDDRRDRQWGFAPTVWIPSLDRSIFLRRTFGDRLHHRRTEETRRVSLAESLGPRGRLGGLSRGHEGLHGEHLALLHEVPLAVD